MMNEKNSVLGCKLLKKFHHEILLTWPGVNKKKVHFTGIQTVVDRSEDRFPKGGGFGLEELLSAHAFAFLVSLRQVTNAENLDQYSEIAGQLSGSFGELSFDLNPVGFKTE